MLPVGEAWYRKLLAYGFALGLAGGVLALLYMGVTGAGVGVFFGDAGTDWWSGEWWWIPLIAAGGLIVALLRKWWSIPEDVPGAIELTRRAWVDPTTAPRLAVLSAVSLISGASLGPTYGLVVMGGGVGSWVVSRLRGEDQEAKEEYTLTGVAGGLGSAFGAPLFAAVLSSELSPTRKGRHLTAFIPQLIAATMGYVVFFGITGRTMLDVYEVPPYRSEFSDLLVAAFLGLLSVVVVMAFVAIHKLVSSVGSRVPSGVVRGIAGGALVGLVAVALPLTLTSGSTQLTTVIQSAPTLGVGFIAAVLGAKMLAVGLSMTSGFLGGNVFPMIFIGGTSGVLVHLIIPGIPLSLAIAAMMAAVPAAYLNAPITLTLMGALTVGLDPSSVIPIAVAVATGYVCLSFIRLFAGRWRSRRSTGVGGSSQG